MDLGEWLLLGGLGCCLLLLFDGYRRARGRRKRAVAASAYASSQTKPFEQTKPVERGSTEPDQTLPEADASSSCPPAPSGSSASFEGDDPATLIGASMSVVGDIDCAESIRVEGRLDGTLAADEHDVVVGALAEVGPQLSAGTLHIAGRVSGEQRVQGAALIAPGARVEGTLTAHRLACHEGASLQGSIQVGGHRSGAARR
ncbi:polymer-forming cytoskeletal protein [Salinicola endophyticus]|uniref:Polymer-forming cytoskeletal protein n=1 Tax=Salinicola endophyticus TaxID=1949083 RepID=A0ABY8FJ27_9GAMM|nr:MULTISPECIES: polymer-forming cytoskeletal protein [Salinicola]WFF42808.1 polymer-forming cytoskeletal protein [Salinicola endophyticus]